ncbi:hypothetical protein BU17DRAFT_95833 [Hysterangium stoloniferum]|nr:hypothetical protein BU17DRAFT_95833 [Hysterangium stoloniferum]
MVQELPPTVFTGPVHDYVEVEKRDVDRFIVSYKLASGKIEYECKHHACKGRRDNSRGPASFTSKSNAREHVYRDMDVTSRFMCTVCPDKFFSSEDSARRHRESKKAGKIYKCSYCQKSFERKDYCKSHEEDEKCQKGVHSATRLSYPPSSYEEYRDDFRDGYREDEYRTLYSMPSTPTTPAAQGYHWSQADYLTLQQPQPQYVQQALPSLDTYGHPYY